MNSSSSLPISNIVQKRKRGVDESGAGEEMVGSVKKPHSASGQLVTALSDAMAEYEAVTLELKKAEFVNQKIKHQAEASITLLQARAQYYATRIQFISNLPAVHRMAKSTAQEIADRKKILSTVVSDAMLERYAKQPEAVQLQEQYESVEELINAEKALMQSLLPKLVQRDQLVKVQSEYQREVLKQLPLLDDIDQALTFEEKQEASRADISNYSPCLFKPTTLNASYEAYKNQRRTLGAQEAYNKELEAQFVACKAGLAEAQKQAIEELALLSAQKEDGQQLLNEARSMTRGPSNG